MDAQCKSRLLQSGLTLVELMVAMAILAILVGLAAPRFEEIAARQRLAAAVNTTIASMNQARMRALSRTGAVVLCPSSDGHQCSGGRAWQHGWISYDDDNGNRRLDPGETVSARIEGLPSDVTATSSIGRPQLRYQADGSAFGSNLTLTLCLRDRPEGRVVVVNNGGRPRTGPATC